MGAGTSPADRAAAAADGPVAEQSEGAAGVPAGGAADSSADGGPAAPADGASPASGDSAAAAPDDTADGAADDGADAAADGRTGSHPAPVPAAAPATGRSRALASLTQDTARPEGGGRAAGGDAPAPARQWPLLAVLGTAAIGLLIVASDPFEQAFRVGTILIGVALIGGAVLRLVIPSVGMLAVRSRFTDLVTYGLLGFLIVMLSLMAQPKPWLDIPFLENAVHFTIR
ncbi:DUF3017 domain-containing protein [Streptomyces laculatispora]|uniref:DUF3017 domain-containing protein n=1 Tax=Streptomyces laculatispora TaxID=887464 RepID=UPI001A9440D3|nr:DUF3017 domain-containing protein [Streptomyces laculatispora]MBO0918705.1 DUF3017 domain-containing protein [Streptomyces laculatispora]